MANVIREDVVKLGFEIDGLKDLTKMQEEINDLRKQLTGGLGDEAFDELKDSAKDTVKPLKNVTEQAEKLRKKVAEIGGKAATAAYNGLKKVASVSFKAIAVGIGAAATAIGGLVVKSAQAFADFEQLEGGVKKLFGDASKTVMKNANNGYKTAGLAANTYMETVTSFSASLISSLGGDTQKAAELADVAIGDMSDNANTFGTDMESIIQTYQSLAKGNYGMLDNLKLG